LRSPVKVNPTLSAAALIALCSAGPAMAQSSTLTFSPSPLVFCTEPGQGISEVPVFIKTSSGTVQFTSADVTSDGWLTVTPTSGTITTTPQVMFFAAIKGGLVTRPTGTYTGQIVLSGNGAVLGKLDAYVNLVLRSPSGARRVR